MNTPDSVFLRGETIDLCIPMREDIERWFRWFNDPEMTKFLTHGLYPNTVEAQTKYYEGLQTDLTRIELLIRPKDGDHPIGVARLSLIDYGRWRRADLAIFKGEQTQEHTLYALEAVAMMTEHAFERVGMRVILGGLFWPVQRNWQQRLELLGYRCDGLLRKGVAKGYSVFDHAYLTCLLEDYLELKRLRGGHYWPGEDRMRELIAGLPKTSYGSILEAAIRKSQEDYFSKLKQA